MSTELCFVMPNRKPVTRTHFGSTDTKEALKPSSKCAAGAAYRSERRRNFQALDNTRWFAERSRKVKPIR